jgi:hypothetical protein
MIQVNWQVKPITSPYISTNVLKGLIITLTLYLSWLVGFYVSPMLAAFFIFMLR